MSSRLPYSSEDFRAAAQAPEHLARWEQQQYQQFRSRAKKSSALPDLLAAAELAIRCQDAPNAQKYIDTVLARAPGEADAHYLKAMLMLGREQKDDALRHLKESVPRLKSKSPDAARVHRLLAEQLLRQEQLHSEAGRQLAKAFELAGGADFVHCTTQTTDTLSAAALDFDLEVFDALWPWENEPLQVRFSSVSTDARKQVYVLEHRHQWVFQFDADGHFVRGMAERDLAAAPFIYPELSWDLTDMTVGPDGRRYVCGSSDRVYVYDDNWQQQRYYAPPASQRTLRPLTLGTDSQQNLFVVYLHLGGIHWFNAEGYHLGAFGQNTIMPSLGKNYFCGLAVTPEDQVCLYDRETIQLYQPGQPQPLATWALPGVSSESMEDPDYPFCWNGIAAGSGGMYVCDTFGNRLLQLDPASGQSQVIATDVKQPFDVAVDGQGTLYLADTGQGRILTRRGQDWQVLLGHSAFRGVTA
ncbi:MAG: hypothetical protein CVV27_04530 [Candidatus Melainabacteria bacterium HGW-Melainabacteria-1]|nr:MAG: hypothetical protein CVV27_04530 [Candidatus Melainabacteria bacterium HGW-Melainabacteria-1]